MGGPSVPRVDLPALSVSAPSSEQLGRMVMLDILPLFLGTESGKDIALAYIKNPIPVHLRVPYPLAIAHYHLMGNHIDIHPEVGGIAHITPADFGNNATLRQHVARVYESVAIHELFHWRTSQRISAPILRVEELDTHHMQARYMLERAEQEPGRAAGLPPAISKKETALLQAWSQGPMHLARYIDARYSNLPSVNSDAKAELQGLRAASRKLWKLSQPLVES
jgi:hypothetical protein